MLKHGKVFIDKTSIIEKLDFPIHENDIHIVNATYENGLVDIHFVVSVPEDHQSNKVSEDTSVRRLRLM